MQISQHLGQTDGNCIVCGGLDGNCAGDAPPPMHILPIYQAGVGDFVVTRQVWETVQISAKRTTRLLKYHQGQRITRAEAEREGLVEAQATD